VNVLHINEHLARKGGVETYLLALMPMLEEQGLANHVLYGQGEAQHWSRAVAMPAVQRAQGRREAYEGVRRVLNDIRPDVVHVHNAQNEGVLQAALEFGPTVITTHDYRWICPSNTFFYKRTRDVCTRSYGHGCFTTTLSKHCLTPRLNYAVPFYRRARWAIRNAHRFAHVIAPSHGARQRYVEAGFPAGDVSVLPYFCPVEPAETPRPIPDPPTITFLGRIAPNKGQEYFVEALGMLPDNVRGVMVGNLGAGGETAMQALSVRCGCPDRLELRAWASREEVRQLLDETSVFIFPSLWPETLGIVGLEALARGVPVVASDVGGTSEWCLEGETGYRVPPKDAGAIRDAVLKLLRDDSMLSSFGQRGIDLIHERFRPQMHVDALIHHYQSAEAMRIV